MREVPVNDSVISRDSAKKTKQTPEKKETSKERRPTQNRDRLEKAKKDLGIVQGKSEPIRKTDEIKTNTDKYTDSQTATRNALAKKSEKEKDKKDLTIKTRPKPAWVNKDEEL